MSLTYEILKAARRLQVYDSFTAFALDVGDTTQEYVDQSLSSLFDAAESAGFGLYVTMDMYATGNGCYSRNASCDSVRLYSITVYIKMTSELTTLSSLMHALRPIKTVATG